MDKTCLEIRDLMALGSDVSDHERIAIESHVSVCAECARELADAQAMRANLALLREGEMPADAAERIWNGVKSAVPGERRLRIVTWSVRAAAVLVIGLTLGYTTKSITGLKGAPAVLTAGTDESSIEDSRATMVPRILYHEGTGADPGLQPPAAQPAPSDARVVHYLPFVDEILESDIIRF